MLLKIVTQKYVKRYVMIGKDCASIKLMAKSGIMVVTREIKNTIDIELECIISISQHMCAYIYLYLPTIVIMLPPKRSEARNQFSMSLRP